MIPLVVIRPAPGCAATVAAARALDLDAHGFSLFTVAPLAWDAPEPDSFDALLIGSANALRHGGPALARYAGKPAYVVGGATAEAASRARLDVVATGGRGLQAVLDRVEPGHAQLLRLAGRARAPLTPPLGVTISERIVYASEPEPFPPALVDLLRAPALTLLHSAKAAQHFAGQCDALGLDRSHIALAAIGPRVAVAAGSGWAAVAPAARPDDAALLVLAKQMCQSFAGSAPPA